MVLHLRAQGEREYVSIRLRSLVDYGEITFTCCRCAIDWKPGMNVTEKKVKKVQQHRAHPGTKRTIIKTMQAESFFNFFSPPEGEQRFAESGDVPDPEFLDPPGSGSGPDPQNPPDIRPDPDNGAPVAESRS